MRRVSARGRILAMIFITGTAWSFPGVPLAAGPLDLIDVPTEEVVDHYGFKLSFRFYSEGGVLAKTSFGVFPRLNVGFGLDTERLVGSEAVDLNRPTLNVRFRIFDGRRQLPALALGYDGQGYFFDETADEYRQRERGLYLVGGGEIVVPGLTVHGGLNIYDFSDDKVYGFTGLHYDHQGLAGFTAEWDNVRTGRDSRINLGGALYLTPGFSIDLIGRDLFAAGRKAERVIRLNYLGSF